MTATNQKAVVAASDTPVTTPLQMLQIAVERGADVETLSRMMDLAERHEANQARKAFSKALSDFRAEDIRVTRNKRVNYTTQKGTTDYAHATLDNIVDVASPFLAKHGLSHYWETSQDDKTITVTCVLTHEAGHSQRTPLSAPADVSGGKNAIQAIGSTVTYLERYTFLAATGLAVKDMDIDAILPAATIDEKQVETLRDLVKKSGTDWDKFLAWAQVDELDQLPVDNFKTAVNFLNRKIKEAK